MFNCFLLAIIILFQILSEVAIDNDYILCVFYYVHMHYMTHIFIDIIRYRFMKCL